MLKILYTSLNEDFHKSLIQKMKEEFPEEFVKKATRYKRWQDCQASILGRLLLERGCELLKHNFNQRQVTLDENDKPFLESNELNFNISHSGSIVICAISKTIELGIDVELIKEIEISDFRGQMTKNEWQNVMNSENRKQSFFDYWTEKEAVLKAHGKGLSVPLKSFEIRSDHTILDGNSFYVSNIPVHSDYSCHVASTAMFDNLTPEVIEVEINELITI